MALERIGRLCRTAVTAQLGAVERKRGWATSAPQERYLRRLMTASCVLHELLVGASTAEKTRQTRGNLVGPLARAGRVITPSQSAWEQAGVAIAVMARREGRDLRCMAKPLVNDFLLAASCRESGSILITDNAADFKLIQKYLKHEFLPTWPSS